MPKPPVSRRSPAWIHVLLGLWLLFCSQWASAVNLNATWQIHWDTGGQLQSSQLYETGLNWQPDTHHGMNGYRPGVLWARFEVPAVPAGQNGWLLSVGLVYLDQIDVYLWGQDAPLASLGDTRPAPEARLSNSRHVVRLPAATIPQQVLLRVQSNSAMNVRADILTDEDMLRALPAQQLRSGAFATLYLLVTVLYLVGALVMRKPIQLAYSFYTLCLLAIFVGINEPLLLNSWLGGTGWANWVTGFGILLAPAASALLWIAILRLRHTHPRLFVIYLAWAGLCALSLLTVNTPAYQAAAQAAVLGILVFAVFNLGLALWHMRKPDHRGAIGLFVVAFVLSTAAAVVNNLSVAGLLSYRPWFALAFDASSVVHVLLLMVATNLSIRRLEAEHREGQFQQRLLARQRDQVQAFSAFVAHELLNPLARIGRSAEMLAREPALPERAGKRAHDIKTWTFECGKLVEVFLNNASLQSARATVKPEPTDLANWVQTVATELNLNYPHAHLNWHVPTSAVQAQMDPLLAKLAVENIVINALKYAGSEKAIDIVIDTDGQSVNITLGDNGPGLSADQYAQLEQTALLRQPTQSQPGFGLGLSLVAHIARAHGGSFSARPRPQGGVSWVLQLGQTVASEARPGTNA